MTAVRAQRGDAPPRVSIAMLAFNHAEFVEQALESALSQEADFAVEIVIGEDCSTDSTRDIVRRYAQAYPHVIRSILHPANVGMHANFQAVTRACRGEYVAFLEADDYWTVPDKLMKQVATLDANPGCVLCFHRVRSISHAGNEQFEDSPAEKYRVAFPPPAALLTENFIAACSVLYRKALEVAAPPGMEELRMADWPTWILLAQRGGIAYLDEAMACYRVHSGGAWSGLRSLHVRLEAEARMFEWVARHLPARDREAAVAAGIRRRNLSARARALERVSELARNGGAMRWIPAAASELARNPALASWRPFVSLVGGLVIGRRAKDRLNRWLGRAQAR